MKKRNKTARREIVAALVLSLAVAVLFGAIFWHGAALELNRLEAVNRARAARMIGE